MIQKERTRPDAATSERSEMGNGLATSISLDHFIPNPATGQFKISDLLSPGQKNAVPLRHLVKLTKQDGRIVRRRIAAERLAGVPILADNQTGYYLPATAAEAKRCIRSMRHRAKEIERAAEAIASATGE